MGPPIAALVGEIARRTLGVLVRRGAAGASAPAGFTEAAAGRGRISPACGGPGPRSRPRYVALERAVRASGSFWRTFCCAQRGTALGRARRQRTEEQAEAGAEVERLRRFALDCVRHAYAHRDSVGEIGRETSGQLLGPADRASLAAPPSATGAGTSGSRSTCPARFVGSGGRIRGRARDLFPSAERRSPLVPPGEFKPGQPLFVLLPDRRRSPAGVRRPGLRTPCAFHSTCARKPTPRDRRPWSGALSDRGAG